MNDTLSANIWGPYYWFVLHTAAEQYPINPDAATRHAYYNLIMNFPLFMPANHLSARALFARITQHDFPVSAYLDNKHDFTHWMHLVHNEVNKELEKPLVSYHDAHKWLKVQSTTQVDALLVYQMLRKWGKNVAYWCICVTLLCLCGYLVWMRTESTYYH